MSKVINLLIVVVISSSLIGCGSSLSNKAIEQGKLAMASKEYDKALSSFEIALNENTKDPEVREMSDIIREYLDAKKYLEREDIEKAEKALDDMDDPYKRYAIKDDVDKLKDELEELKISMEESEDEGKEEVKEVQVVTSEKKNDPPVEVSKPVVQSKVDQYLMKASNVSSIVSQMYYERGINEYGDNSHVDESVYIEAQQIRYNKWDDLLNEIWGVLKQQLPKNQMDELLKIQRQWIKDKEALAKSYSNQADKLISLSISTEQRCYELIDGYMK